MQRWEVRWEDIQLERLLGRGSYGRVYYGRWAETPCAVKVLLTTGALGRVQGVSRQTSLEQAQLRQGADCTTLLPRTCLQTWWSRGSCSCRPACCTTCRRWAVCVWLRGLEMAAGMGGQVPSEKGY